MDAILATVTSQVEILLSELGSDYAITKIVDSIPTVSADPSRLTASFKELHRLFTTKIKQFLPNLVFDTYSFNAIVGLSDPQGRIIILGRILIREAGTFLETRNWQDDYVLYTRLMPPGSHSNSLVLNSIPIEELLILSQTAVTVAMTNPPSFIVNPFEQGNVLGRFGGLIGLVLPLVLLLNTSGNYQIENFIMPPGMNNITFSITGAGGRGTVARRETRPILKIFESGGGAGAYLRFTIPYEFTDSGLDFRVTNLHIAPGIASVVYRDNNGVRYAVTGIAGPGGDSKYVFGSAPIPGGIASIVDSFPPTITFPISVAVQANGPPGGGPNQNGTTNGYTSSGSGVGLIDSACFEPCIDKCSKVKKKCKRCDGNGCSKCNSTNTVAEQVRYSEPAGTPPEGVMTMPGSLYTVVSKGGGLGQRVQGFGSGGAAVPSNWPDREQYIRAGPAYSEILLSA